MSPRGSAAWAMLSRTTHAPWLSCSATRVLPNVIHCIPEKIKEDDEQTTKVNITTGYPLAATSAANLVGVLLALRLQGLNKDGKTYRLSYVNQVLRHPYAKYISEGAPTLFEKLNEHKTFFPTVGQLTEEQDTAICRLFDTKDLKAADSKQRNVTILQWVADI